MAAGTDARAMPRPSPLSSRRFIGIASPLGGIESLHREGEGLEQVAGAAQNRLADLRALSGGLQAIQEVGMKVIGPHKERCFFHVRFLRSIPRRSPPSSGSSSFSSLSARGTSASESRRSAVTERAMRARAAEKWVRRGTS